MIFSWPLEAFNNLSTSHLTKLSVKIEQLGITHVHDPFPNVCHPPPLSPWCFPLICVYSSAERDASWLGRLQIKKTVDLKQKKPEPQRLKDSVELHEEKKGTVGPFSQIKDSFNAPSEESKIKRSHASHRPLRWGSWEGQKKKSCSVFSGTIANCLTLGLRSQ